MSLPLLNEQELYSQVSQQQITTVTDSLHSNEDFSLKQDASIALLDQLFPEQKLEDKSTKQARAILGELTEKFTTDELQEIISIFQYLTESWLDMYERELFEGKTLQELLNLGG